MRRGTGLTGPQVNEDTQMSRLSKNFNFFVLSFQWWLGWSDILVLVTTNFLKKEHRTSIFPVICIKIYNLRG